MDAELKQRFDKETTENDVVIYMKGTAKMPRCGFSAAAVGCLLQLGLDVHDVNVLEDQEVWQGIKEYSDWPTIPQIYIKGEFMGGGDIIREMAETGELKTFCEEKGVLAA